MKLTNEEFKRFKELLKAKDHLKGDEKAELAALQAKKNEKGSNDLKWWNAYPELTKGASNLPFNYLAGENVGLYRNLAARNYLVSGVARVGYMPSIGRSLEQSDAFNAQMRQLWLDMHRKYRGMGGYQRSDLGMAILAIIGVFTTLAKFERIYGICNTFKLQNRNVPYTLYEALRIGVGVPDSLAELRYGLNQRIARMQQLCLPKGIAAVEAELVTCSNIFKDSENPRASLFFFDPDAFAKYEATLISSGGCVAYYDYSTKQTALTPGGLPAFGVGDMLDVLDTQLNALLNDDDIAKMCSDLIAAYGPENVMTVNFIPEMLQIEPVHDYERLLQFHNATPNGQVFSKYPVAAVSVSDANAFATNGAKVVVFQFNDVIHNELTRLDGTYNGYVADGIMVVAVSPNWTIDAKEADVVFDTWVDKPGEGEIMCGTRFTSIAGNTKSVGTDYYQDITSHGTCVVTSIVIYTKIGSSYNVYGFTGNAWTAGSMSIDAAVLLTAFDWHPIFYLDTNGGDYRIFADLDNLTVIDNQNLGRIHDVAIYSAFKIPSVSYIQ